MIGGGGFSLEIMEAFRRLAKMQKEIAEAPSRMRRRAEIQTDPRVPQTFTAYRHPDGWFELNYPKEWDLQEKAGKIFISSKKVGSFVQASVAKDSPTFWKDLEEGFSKIAKSESIDSIRQGNPQHARGRIELDGRRFQWDVYAYRAPGGIVVLATGNVLDSKRGKALEDYEDTVLSRIVQHFKVTRT